MFDPPIDQLLMDLDHLRADFYKGQLVYFLLPFYPGFLVCNSAPVSIQSLSFYVSIWDAEHRALVFLSVKTQHGVVRRH